MHGLNNPRGLAFGPDGALFVAEAGRGGSGPCFVSGQTVCYGPTGAVGRLWKGKQDTVVTGLPSYANAAGRAEGPNAIALLGMGGAYVTIGFESDPAIRSQAAAFAGFARLVRVAPTAFVPGKASPRSKVQWEYVADLGAYEIAVNPDCGRIDSNPFGLLAIPGSIIIVDAGQIRSFGGRRTALSRRSRRSPPGTQVSRVRTVPRCPPTRRRRRQSQHPS